MNLEQFGILAGLVVSLISIFSVFYLAGVKIAKLELRVETLWDNYKATMDYLVRRGQAEAVHTGLATINSPVVVADEAKGKFESMSAELQEFYRQHCRGLSESEFFLEIEKAFGDRILKEVCVPEKLYLGACLIVAMAVAKDADKKT